MNTVLFDLDGTLLPMDQDIFVENYLKKLGDKFRPLGYDPEIMIKAIWTGTKAMILNDGSMSNEQRFWKTFTELLGEEVKALEPEFENFYRYEFNTIKDMITPNPLAGQGVKMLKEKGYSLVLATNPLFPKIATMARMAWAGLNIDDFNLITTYENSSYGKPNLNYYKEILNTINRCPEDCLMVGNDVLEDMCVNQLGMDSFLLTDHIAHAEGADITQYRHGSFTELAEYINRLPALSNEID